MLPQRDVVQPLRSVLSFIDDLQAECQSASGHVFRDQRILLGTSYHIMASAVSRSPSVLESIGREKADRVLQLAGSSSTASQQKVYNYGASFVTCCMFSKR